MNFKCFYYRPRLTLIRDSISDNGSEEKKHVIKEEDSYLIDLTLEEDPIDIK